MPEAQYPSDLIKLTERVLLTAASGMVIGPESVSTQDFFPAVHIVPGEIPVHIRSTLPIPAGVQVLGSVTYDYPRGGIEFEIVLEVDGDKVAAMRTIESALTSDGWSRVTSKAQGFHDMGGFKTGRPSTGSDITSNTATTSPDGGNIRIYCRGEHGPAVLVQFIRSFHDTSDIRITGDRWSDQRCSPTSSNDTLKLPDLEVPPGVTIVRRGLLEGVVGPDGPVSTTVLIKTDNSLQTINEDIGMQFTADGWSLQDQSQDSLTALTKWRRLDKQDIIATIPVVRQSPELVLVRIEALKE